MFNPKSFSLILSVLIMSLFIVFLVFAWTVPTQSPPLGNVDTPLNVGSTGQSKAGGLILNTGGATTGLIVQSGNVGIGMTNPQSLLHINSTTANVYIQFPVNSTALAAADCDSEANATGK